MNEYRICKNKYDYYKVQVKKKKITPRSFWNWLMRKEETPEFYWEDYKEVFFSGSSMYEEPVKRNTREECEHYIKKRLKSEEKNNNDWTCDEENYN